MPADLLPLAHEFAPDLLVCEQAELAGPIAAALLGVPDASRAFGPLLPQHRVAREGEALAEVWREHGLEPRPHAGTYDHLYVEQQAHERERRGDRGGVGGRGQHGRRDDREPEADAGLDRPGDHEGRHCGQQAG